MEITTTRKPDWRAILRWSFVVICGLCGLLISLRGGVSVVRMGAGDGGFTVFFLCLLAGISLPFFLVSYFGALGQYQKMIDVILVVVALLLWAFFSLLISRLGVIKWLDPIMRSEPASWHIFFAVLGLLATLGILFGPVYAAIRIFWFLRKRIALRWFSAGK